ncbi:unnamed protein product [Ciceribacter selenitireducens ATCC BAA-1503]|uniref:Uncharacterized protein n=1 Tax=Ciceribacter selenitireducens ATCC BAA-1503 TaxID=1336235 RepID=A0A376AJ10_9HYPH|nr:unnamed protein product [Ciceribacter selenitireducens ATCC BAA-1503]
MAIVPFASHADRSCVLPAGRPAWSISRAGAIISMFWPGPSNLAGSGLQGIRATVFDMLLETNCGIPAAGDREAAGGVVRRPVKPSRDERISASVPCETVFSHIYQWPVRFLRIFSNAVLTGERSESITPLTERGRRRCWRRSLSFMRNLLEIG